MKNRKGRAVIGVLVIAVLFYGSLWQVAKADTGMFFDVQVGWKLPHSAACLGDYVCLGSDQLIVGQVGGRNPTAQFRLGWEFRNGWEVGFEHWSHWRDGGPFNSNPELYKDELYVKKRFRFLRRGR